MLFSAAAYTTAVDHGALHCVYFISPMLELHFPCAMHWLAAGLSSCPCCHQSEVDVIMWSALSPWPPWLYSGGSAWDLDFVILTLKSHPLTSKGLEWHECVSCGHLCSYYWFSLLEVEHCPHDLWAAFVSRFSGASKQKKEWRQSIDFQKIASVFGLSFWLGLTCPLCTVTALITQPRRLIQFNFFCFQMNA